jgi:hypothetical protein
MSDRSITPLPPADFTPVMGNYKTLQPFRYWCQKVLPLVYDDSLSYYELLCKVVDYLNKTMEDVETLHGDVTNLHKAYEELQNYVNTYFSSLDVQEEIDNKLNDMANSGELSNLIKPLIDVNQPKIVKNENEMTNKSTIYILSTNGYAYQWDGEKFAPTGLIFNIPVNAYTSTSFQNPIDINDATNIGSWYINRFSLNGLVDVDVKKYYWSVYVIKPIVLNNIDCFQLLIGAGVVSGTPTVMYYRSSLYNVFNSFSRIVNDKNIANNYASKSPGKYSVDEKNPNTSYLIDRDSLNAYKAELNVDISKYYWSVLNIAPSTASYVDVSQILIGVPVSTVGRCLMYMRSSITTDSVKWTTFSLINVEQKISNIPKVAFCGDSFTAVTSVKSYVNFLNEMGVCEGVNLGISGATADSWYTANEENITDEYDEFFIALGLNGLSTPNGEYNSSDTSTFCGQINRIINKIIEVNPKARIIIWCMDAWYRKERSDVLKELADYNGCEYYSMLSDANIPLRLNGKYAGVMNNLNSNIVTAKNNALKLADNHPNEAAQYLLATYLRNII